MVNFKGSQFEREIILWAVRCCRARVKARVEKSY
jgi:hypothetical protein